MFELDLPAKLDTLAKFVTRHYHNQKAFSIFSADDKLVIHTWKYDNLRISLEWTDIWERVGRRKGWKIRPAMNGIPFHILTFSWQFAMSTISWMDQLDPLMITTPWIPCWIKSSHLVILLAQKRRVNNTPKKNRNVIAESEALIAQQSDLFNRWRKRVFRQSSSLSLPDYLVKSTRKSDMPNQSIFKSEMRRFKEQNFTNLVLVRLFFDIRTGKPWWSRMACIQSCGPTLTIAAIPQ
jgi:hypothetical protein